MRLSMFVRSGAFLMTAHAFVCDALRTPIGRYAGAMSAVRADDLAAVSLRALLARLVATAVEQLARNGGRYALCTMCIGVGQGIAVVLQRV
jgi:acetyl-CoA acetyltransferase